MSSPFEDVLYDRYSRCCICGVKCFGGIYTNGIGYDEDALAVGIDPGPVKFFCWDCESHIPDLEPEVKRKFEQQGWCGFASEYGPKCRNEKPCKDHEGKTSYR